MTVPPCEAAGICGPDHGHSKTAGCSFAPYDPRCVSLACSNGFCSRCDGVGPQEDLQGFPAPECAHPCHYQRPASSCSICGGPRYEDGTGMHRPPCIVLNGVLNPPRLVDTSAQSDGGSEQ